MRFFKNLYISLFNLFQVMFIRLSFVNFSNLFFFFLLRAHAHDIRRQTAQELKSDHGNGSAAEKAAAIAQRIGRSSVTSISSLTSQGPATTGSSQGSFLHPGSVSFASGSVTFGDVSSVRGLMPICGFSMQMGFILG